jgi:hypothetical protein
MPGVSFDRRPEGYRHWRLRLEAPLFGYQYVHLA